jgi:hypothetical protein
MQSRGRSRRMAAGTNRMKTLHLGKVSSVSICQQETLHAATGPCTTQVKPLWVLVYEDRTAPVTMTMCLQGKGILRLSCSMQFDVGPV